VAPLEEVRDEIVAELQAARGGEKAKAAAEAAKKAIAHGKTLEEIAAETGMAVSTPEPFAQNAPIPGVGRSFPLAAALLGLEAGQRSDVFEVEKKWVIARLEEKIPKAIRPLEEVRELVRGELRRIEGEKKGKAAAEELLARARELGSLEAAAEAAGRTVETSQSVRRDGPYVPGMGLNQELKDAVFALGDDEPVADEVYVVLGDAMVVGLGEIDVPTDEEVSERMAQVRESLLRASRQNLLRRYVDELKAATNIQVNADLLEQLPPVG